MEPVIYVKTKSIIWGSGVARVFLLVGLFFLVLGKGFGQVLKANATATPGTVCAGENVQLDAGASGGSGSYTYTWTSVPAGFTSSAASPVANPTVNTTYNVAVYDGTTTVNSSADVTVTPNASIGSVSGTTPLCIGTSANYNANAVVLGGGTGSWSSSNTGIATVNTSGSVKGISVGSCNIIYTITGGCGGTVFAQQPVTINPDASIGSVTGTASLCIGATATYTANAVVLGGGTGAWTSSNTGVATVNSSGLVTAVSAGSSNIIYTITGGCGGTVSAQQPVTINPNASIGSVSGTTPLCIGGTTTFSANSVVLGGGTGSWSSSNTGVATVISSGLVTGISAGSCNIIYTITGGCGGMVSAQQPVVINPNASIGSVSGTTPLCVGATTTYNANAVVPGGGSGAWSSSNTGIATVNSSGLVTAISEGSCNIIYTLTGGCGGTVSAQQPVTVNSLSIAPTGVNITNNNTCNGVSKTLTVTGGTLGTGATWQWFTGSCGGTSAGSGLSIAVDPLAGTSTTYYVHAAGTCNTTTCANGTVVVNPTVSTPIFALGATSTRCQGAGLITYTASATNTTGITYSLDAASIAGGNTIVAATGDVTYLAGWSGTSIITASAAGCGGPTTAVHTVTINPTVGTPTAITVSAGTEPVCQLTNGTTTTTYSTTAASSTGFNWSISNPAAGSIGATTGIMSWANGFSGTVNIQVTASGCNGPSAQVIRPVTISPTVGTPTAIAVSAGTEPVCQLTNGTTTTTYSTTATNSTGFNWSISNPAAGSIGATTGVMTWANGFSGAVIIQVTANGCNGPSAQVTRPVTVTPTVGTPVFTLGATSTRCQGAGSVTYTANATNTTGITYSLDAASIAGGNSIVSATGAVTYVAGWSGTSIITTNAAGCNGPATAIHTVTVTPTVGTPTVPTPSASTICQGSVGTAYTTSATNATSYNWSVTGTGNSISGTGTTGTVTWAAGFTGTAAVGVTANGCNGPSASASTTVTVRPTPTATISGTTSVCQNAALPNITFTNPQTYAVTITYNINGANQTTISVGASSSATVAASTTTAGTFVYNLVSVVYQSAPACSNTITGTATVTVNPLPTPILTSSDADNIICSGTSVTFTATAAGATNYNFRIGGITVQNGTLPAYTTSSLINGQVVGVIVTNVSGCSAPSNDIINFVNALPFMVVTSPPTCAPDLATYSLGVTVSSGTVTSTSGTVTNTGGNVWSIIGVLSGVNITVKVTDMNGCENSLVVTAPDCRCPTIVAPVSGGDKSYCAGGVVPTITASVSAGETVDWYDSAAGGILLKSGSLSYTPPGAGVYYAMTRNTTSGCVSSTRTPVTVTMIALPVPTLSSSDPDNKFCAGTSVTFTAGGGTNYNFRVAGVSVQNGTSVTYTTNSLIDGLVVDVIVTNANGCIATSTGITNTVNALPNPTLTSSDADNIFCAGTSITFTAGGGTNFNFRVSGASVQNGTSATYITTSLTNGQFVDVIVTNANGCIATAPGITNTVNTMPIPSLTSSDTDNKFCAGTSVTFTAGGGISYNFRVAGTSVQNGGSQVYTTSSLTNGQVVDVIVTNFSGCTSTSAGITNNVVTIPSANPGPGGNACSLSHQLNAVPSVGTGTWTKASGAGTATFSPDANSANATVSVTAYGTYTFTWTEVNNICSNSSTITVNFFQQPAANPGTGGNNCGQDFYLNAVPSVGSGTWAKTSGAGTAVFSPSPNIPNTKVTVSSYGIYTFKWTEVNGTCSDNASVNITFIQAPSADAGNGGIECDLDFVLNAVPGTGTSTWTKIAGPGNAIFTPNPNQADAKVTVDQFGTYDFSWTLVNSTCQSSDNIRVVFHDLPAVSAGKDTIICKNGTVQLNASGDGAFLWQPDTLVSNPSIPNPIANPEVTTLFKVTLTDQFGCKNSDEIEIEVRNKPVANGGPDKVLEYIFQTTLDATAPGNKENGKWHVYSGSGEFTDSSYAQTQVSELALGKNILTWTVTNGACPPSVDSVKITVNDLVIPTLITPNMDGKNDNFVLRGIESLGKTELIIFDRRGAQVYRNTNYDNDWNGVDYNGNALPDDTYFFVLRTQKREPISGYIVIKR